MRFQPVVSGFILLALVVTVLLSLARRTPTTSPPGSPDLSVTFLGWTNDPGTSTYPTLVVVGSGTGRHILLAITNASRTQNVQFGIAELEFSTPQGFQVGPRTFFQHPLGMTWRPGFGTWIAMQLPVWMPTNVPGRMRLWIVRERQGWTAVVNRWAGREVFVPWGRHEVSVILPAPARRDDRR